MLVKAIRTWSQMDYDGTITECSESAYVNSQYITEIFPDGELYALNIRNNVLGTHQITQEEFNKLVKEMNNVSES